MTQINTIDFRDKKLKYYNYDFPPFNSQYYMESELNIIEKYLNLEPDNVFIDVGCAVGSWTLPALSLGADVIGFEPLYIYSNIIFDNISINGWQKKFKLVTRMLCNKDNEWVPFTYGRYNVFMPEPFLINSIRLDSVPLKRLDMIKIDVEGTELEVLEGATSTLQIYRPKIILEHHQDVAGSIERVQSLLPDGYTSTMIEEGRWLFCPK